jgi:hypothetical protein
MGKKTKMSIIAGVMVDCNQLSRDKLAYWRYFQAIS